MAEFKNIVVEQKAATLIVTIARERALNALNRETIAELQQLFAERWKDDSVAVVILTGAGDRAFVAGADITEITGMGVRDGTRYSGNGLYLMKTIQDFPRPVIAAINGFALGGGCELAMACDIRLASEKARFGLPEVALGLIPGFGGTQRLARLVGRGKAMQLILSGDMIDAAKAHCIGLVEEVYPPDQLMEAALKLAETIASRGGVAVALAKECINRGSDCPLGPACDMEKANFGAIMESADKNEGCEAFLKKRAPKFIGR